MAVFIMANKYAKDVEEEDTKTMMIVLALSQYIRQVRFRSVPAYIRVYVSPCKQGKCVQGEWDMVVLVWAGEHAIMGLFVCVNLCRSPFIM